MKKIGLLLLIPLTAILSSGITYYVTNNEPLLIKYEPVEPVISQATASKACAQYLYEQLTKEKSSRSSLIHIIDSEGYGFSSREIYCKAVAEETVPRNIGNKILYVEKAHYHFSIEDRAELRIYNRSELELYEAIERYKERFKL